MINDLDDVIKEFAMQRNYGMANYLRSWRDGRTQPDTILDILVSLALCEHVNRSSIKTERLRTMARLRYTGACISDIDYVGDRNIKQSQMEWFGSSHWIDAHENVLITGPAGSGKTFIACALANAAISYGYSAFYHRIPRLFEDLALANRDGSMPKLRDKISKYQVLILDEWGVVQMSQQQKQDLLEILDDRDASSSTIMISQMPTEQWYDYINDPVRSDSFMERIFNGSFLINLAGESRRKYKSNLEDMFNAR